MIIDFRGRPPTPEYLRIFDLADLGRFGKKIGASEVSRSFQNGSMEEFFDAFEHDCAEAGHSISARTMMERIAETSMPRPAMLTAIGRIRERGLRTAALTNNWKPESESKSATLGLAPLFDVFVESSVEGLRKPDPRIYELVCDRLGVPPSAAVFLDDIGSNLKTARQLGMTTIKVEAPEPALAELSDLLGFPLED